MADSSSGSNTSLLASMILLSGGGGGRDNDSDSDGCCCRHDKTGPRHVVGSALIHNGIEWRRRRRTTLPARASSHSTAAAAGGGCKDAAAAAATVASRAEATAVSNIGAAAGALDETTNSQQVARFAWRNTQSGGGIARRRIESANTRRIGCRSSGSGRLALIPLLVAVVFVWHVAQPGACKPSIETQQELAPQIGNSLLNFSPQPPPPPSITQSPASIESHSQREQHPTTLASFLNKITSVFIAPTTTTATSTTTPSPTLRETTESTTAASGEGELEEEEEEDGAGARRDDHDAESCKGISADDSAEGANITNNERLVNLQSCIQGKVRRTLAGAARNGMEMFEKLTLSGGCSASLMGLMTAVGQLKSYAFKFLDASAKVPSGVMYGLLSDYGDFDQCLSIRSNPSVSIEDEAEEGSFSGKYCLMSLKLNYHADVPANATAPEGIIEDGILWDDLLRHYWTSNSSKGFQIGVCLPSRCTNDDLSQLYQHVAKSYNVIGDIISCQDGRDLKQQYRPDLVQRAIIYVVYALLSLTFIGTCIDRYSTRACTANGRQKHACSGDRSICLLVRTLVCFSIARNWSTFMRKDNSRMASSQLWGCSFDGEESNPTTASPSSSVASKSHESVTEGTSINRSSSDDADFIDLNESIRIANRAASSDVNKLSQLTVKIHQLPHHQHHYHHHHNRLASNHRVAERINPLAHLSGLRLFVIIWITVGYSFLYPSANNYQYYRSIVNMNFTRDSVWFATTNFTLGIEMLLYMTGLSFVYKLVNQNHSSYSHPSTGSIRAEIGGEGVPRLILKRVLRFWPTYLTVIALAIMAPLLSDGPMWPEMVSRRLGDSCRRNWWSNLLFINNFLNQSDICLPSSWFISVLMQLFFIGSIIIVLVRQVSMRAGLLALVSLLIGSSAYSFYYAYFMRVRAPMIRMDESFVMEMDEDIFRLYTNIFNNLGPFLVGMAGGFALIKAQIRKRETNSAQSSADGRGRRKSSSRGSQSIEDGRRYVIVWFCELSTALIVSLIAVLVLSSVFHQDYSPLMSAIYWSLHRIGWAIVTGYVIHKCATGKWKLLNDFLSLSTFIPLSRLIFIAYLVYPIFIHIHSGLVRDGLHVSIYNMLNIYITRLVMTFVTALIIHLLVELPFCSIEDMYFSRWLSKTTRNELSRENDPNRLHPLLAVAPIIAINDQKIDQEISWKDKKESKTLDCGQTNSPSDKSASESVATIEQHQQQLAI